MGAQHVAELFGHVFRICAENPDKDAQTVAEEVVELMSEYDFHPDDMGADVAMIDLGFGHLLTEQESDEEEEEY